ncbi:MAG TPA: ThuA domain-containing protein [Ohtaekwangia sp.]|nr:ThuA domain-containing protein [Ohtaekwangia sp.]
MPSHFIIRNLCFAALVVFTVLSCNNQTKDETTKSEAKKILKALIIDGQNNHGVWPKTTVMMKDYLEQTGLFQVDVERTALAWQGPHNDNDIGMDEKKSVQLIGQFPIEGGKKVTMMEKPQADSTYKPDFEKYDVVISNFGWNTAPWPLQTREALEQFVNNGGGLVIIHAADNSFPEWLAYNKMIGLGGWGDRTEKDGPYVYYNSDNKLVRDTTAGGAGSHGKQYEFSVVIRDTLHPITKGLPSEWLHAPDELYDRLRGPAENMTVLATSYSDEEQNASLFSPLRGTNRHEPMMMTVDYGKGRVFHTPMGHADYSIECVGFITMFQRATEWTATGNVTQTHIPVDFPTADKSSQRPWVQQE